MIEDQNKRTFEKPVITGSSFPNRASHFLQQKVGFDAGKKLGRRDEKHANLEGKQG